MNNDIITITNENKSELKGLPKCIDVCKHYDPTPYPEHSGRLARCTNPHSEHFIIGCFTPACRSCFEPKEDDDREQK